MFPNTISEMQHRLLQRCKQLHQRGLFRNLQRVLCGCRFFSGIFEHKTSPRAMINNDGHFDAKDIQAMEQALTGTTSLSGSDLIARGDFKR